MSDNVNNNPDIPPHSRTTAALCLPVEDPEIPEVMDLEDGRYWTLTEFVGSDYAQALNRRAEAMDGLITGTLRYVCAECGVGVKLLAHHKSGRFFFRHTIEDGRCSAVTRGELTQEQINARKYEGQGESELHKRTKALLIASLEADSRFSTIQLEKRWRGRDSRWRKPDVQAVYAAPKTGQLIPIAFEVQLSTTFLDVIRARRQFYLQNGGLLFWIFANFNETGRRLTQDDVFFNNNQNAFVVNAKTTAKSGASGTFHVGCCYFSPEDELNGDSKLRKKLVSINDLTLDVPRQETYYFDYRGAVHAQKLAERARVDPILLKFETAWIDPARDRYDVELIWKTFYQEVREFGIQLPQYSRDPDHAIVSALYSAKHGRVIAWGYNRLIEVCHLIAKSYPEYLRLFRAGLLAYGRGEQVRNEDKSRAWIQHKEQYIKAMRDGEPLYDEKKEYYDALRILFPEVFEALDGGLVLA